MPTSRKLGALKRSAGLLTSRVERHRSYQLPTRLLSPTAALRRLDAVREFSSLAINEQAIEIAESLLALSIVPKKAAEDALHIAIATAHGMDFLLTWNCLHIANPMIQARIAAHLESIGLLLPFVCTPEELLGKESE